MWGTVAGMAAGGERGGMTQKGHSYLDLTALSEIGALLLAPQPAWLWSLNAKTVLWANAAAAAHSGAESIEALLGAETDRSSTTLDIADVAAGLSEAMPQMRQLQVAGADQGEPLWCLCTRFTLTDGSDVLLTVATEVGGNVDPVSVRAGRLVRSIAGHDIAVAIARTDGRIVATSTGFSDLPGAADVISDLTAELGSDRLRKRKETFGGQRRLAGAAAAATPDGDFLLIIIGPAEGAEESPKSDPAQEPAPEMPAIIERASDGDGAPAPKRSERRSGRFTFSLGPDLTFSAVSEELANAVGAGNADVVGRSWDDISDQFDLDPDRTIAIALARRDTWSGVTVHWPGETGDIAIDLTAIPSFRNGGAFEGFRGFGVVRGGASQHRLEDEEAEASADETDASEPEKVAEPEPSNVVRLPSADRVDDKRAALSGDEQDAFRRIAETLRSVVRRTEKPSDDLRASSTEPSTPNETKRPPAKVPLRLLDRLPLGVLIFREKAVMFANRVLLDRLGYPNVAALANAGGVDALFGDALADVEEADATYRVPLVTADRRRINAEARLHIVPWDDGPATMLSIRDPMIEPAPLAEIEQDPTRSRVRELEAILDTATDGTLVLDEQGRILGLNRSVEALFGIESTDVLGKPFTELLVEESQRPAEDYLEGLAKNGVASVLNDGREVIGRVPNGGLIPLFMTMGRLAEHKFCVVLRDITQWKNAEEELVSARRSAEIANKQKSDFLAKISHEIRTPLNAIIGFSDVMLEERFGPIGVDRYREYLKDIRLSGRHLMSLVNDLLDLSKIEAGHLDLAFGAVAINQILQECVALMQPEANRKRIIIRTSLTDGVPQVVADERSLRQIALNLLSNAVKFNVAGGQVIVSTALDNGEVILRIRDTGIGMTEKEVETALKPFQQIATSGPARFEGTGLGLPLTKALVEANRASFEIDSEPSKGTLVRIAFPIERVLQA